MRASVQLLSGCLLGLVRSFISVYLPTPVAISGGGISVNCHPVIGRFHVGHRWPLPPTGPKQNSIYGALLPVPRGVCSSLRKRRQNVRKEEPLCLASSHLGIAEPKHRRRVRPAGRANQDRKEARCGEERRGGKRGKDVSVCM